MKTSLININTFTENEDYQYIGRPGQFGNPFEIGRDGTREEVVDKYRAWFYTQVDQRIYFKRAVEGLRGRVLGCHCSPLKCHGDIIIEYLEGING